VALVRLVDSLRRQRLRVVLRRYSTSASSTGLSQRAFGFFSSIVMGGLPKMAYRRWLTEETKPQTYVKLVVSGEVDASLLEAPQDFVKRQKKRLGPTILGNPRLIDGATPSQRLRRLGACSGADAWIWTAWGGCRGRLRLSFFGHDGGSDDVE
jgi:hypothetical protein